MVRIQLKIRLVERLGRVQAIGLNQWIFALALQYLFQVGEFSVTAKVHDEVGRAELGRQAHRLEDDLKDAHTHVAGARLECSSRRMQPTMLFPSRRKLLQRFDDRQRELAYFAGFGAIGKLVIGPKVAKDLHQVRFAGAVKTADPRTCLFAASQTREIASEDLLQRRFILPLADKGLELVAQSCFIRIVVAGDAFVRQCPGQRILQKKLFGLHRHSAVIGVAR